MKINTTAGEISIISLENFLKLIPIQYVMVDDNNSTVYSEQIEPPVYFAATYDNNPAIDETDIIYKQTTVQLEECAAVNKLSQLISQVKKETITISKNIEWELEDRCVESLEEYGCASYAVNIDQRTWMVADPKDFVILKNDKYEHIVCIHKYRNKIVYYEKAELKE